MRGASPRRSPAPMLALVNDLRMICHMVLTGYKGIISLKLPANHAGPTIYWQAIVSHIVRGRVRGRIAQMEARQTTNLKVAGSSPAMVKNTVLHHGFCVIMIIK
jgi:hypothetical protein